MATPARDQKSTGGSGRLAGRVAIVTGASRGIGEAIALAFAREGAAVAVAARTEQTWNEKLPGTIHETAEKIRQAGGRAVAVRCDVTKEDDLVQLVETARAELGPIDLLVNNAAITVPGRPPSASDQKPAAEAQSSQAAAARARSREQGKGTPQVGFLSFPLYGYKSHYDVNVFGPYRLMQLVLPDMVERRRGAVVNISSDAAHRPGEGPYPPGATLGSFAYGGSKAALQHLTQAVACDMAPYGIAVNALMPSLAVPSPGMLYYSPDLLQKEYVSLESFAEATIRLALATPADITGRVAFSEDILHPELGRRGWIGQR